MKATLGVAGTSLLVIALTGCGGGASATPSPTETVAPFIQARVDCDLTTREGLDVGDNGHTATLQSKSQYGSIGLDVSEVMCILHKVNVPDSVVSQIQGTRALDGTQRAAWDGYSASWTYHPDNGLRVVVTDSK
jgi:hypothetical protein